MMTKTSRFFEWFIQFTIVISLLVHLIDLHLVPTAEQLKLFVILYWIDVVIVFIFTVEYLVRWYYASDRWRYPFTVMAIIDLLVILPFYLSFLIDLRSLRVLRMVRVLQLLKFYRHSQFMRLFVASIRKVTVQLQLIGLILLFVLLISSTTLFEAESEAQPDKIRHMGDALWWSVVTLATVGYGDISPVTVVGRVVASITMIVGLGIFGTFISLIGSALITAMQNEEHNSVTLSRSVFQKFRKFMKEMNEPDDVEFLKQQTEQAVLDYMASRRRQDLRE